MAGVFSEVIFLILSRAGWPRFIRWSIDLGGESSGQFAGISMSLESCRTAMEGFWEFFGEYVTSFIFVSLIFCNIEVIDLWNDSLGGSNFQG